MTDVKDVLNDIYLTYKKYKADGNLKAWNEKMGELTKKYRGDDFYTGIALVFAKRIVKERGEEF